MDSTEQPQDAAPPAPSLYHNLPTTLRGRILTHYYMNWLDHGILRTVWTNLYQVAPGVWRGNHPTTRRWHQLRAMGIRTVLNLRAESRMPVYLSEQRICTALGLNLITVHLSAREAPPRDRLLTLLDMFRSIEHPFFMHCKSGADRTGLAAAIYLLAIVGRPLSDARAMLAPRFVHLRFTRTGVLDAFLEAYGAHHAATGDDFETWLRDHYDATALQADFDRQHLSPRDRLRRLFGMTRA
jgi:protein tyrosine phosphatase (PTP) superfamily phosphohydrolase (DUF442 family)